MAGWGYFFCFVLAGWLWFGVGLGLAWLDCMAGRRGENCPRRWGGFSLDRLVLDWVGFCLFDQGAASGVRGTLTVHGRLARGRGVVWLGLI